MAQNSVPLKSRVIEALDSIIDGLPVIDNKETEAEFTRTLTAMKSVLRVEPVNYVAFMECNRNITDTVLKASSELNDRLKLGIIDFQEHRERSQVLFEFHYDYLDLSLLEYVLPAEPAAGTTR